MKQTSTISSQRGYSARPVSPERAVDIQREAARLALIDGNEDEMRRCDQRAKEVVDRPDTSRPESPPTWITPGPAGVADPVLVMLRNKRLTVGAVIAAMEYRLFKEHQPSGFSSFSGSGGSAERVDGRRGISLEAKQDARRSGEFMVKQMQEELGPNLFPIVEQLILGNIPMSKGVERLGGRRQKAFGTLEKAIQDTLNYAANRIGRKAQETV